MANDSQPNRLLGLQVPASKSKQRAARSVTPASTPAIKTKAPTPEEIARKAYEIWCARGCEQGHDVEHWLEAEKQLRRQR